jgi:hypothetical protein
VPASPSLLPDLHLMTQEHLNPCFQTRWACHKCGFFESWTSDLVAALICFKCKQPAYQMPNETCKVMTSRALPFYSRPRGNTKTFEAEYTFSERATSIQRRKRN